MADQPLHLARRVAQPHVVEHVVEPLAAPPDLGAAGEVRVVVRRLRRAREIPAAHGAQALRRGVHDAAPVAAEQQARRGAHLPVAVEQPRPLHRRQGQQIGQIAGVRGGQGCVVRQPRRHKGRRLGGQVRIAAVELGQVVGPDQGVVDPHEPAQPPGAISARQPGLLVQPPGDEARDPAVGIRVAGGADVGPHPAGGAVAADQIPELAGREVGQLVEADQRRLRALPVVDGLVVLQVGEADARPARKAPLQGGAESLRAQQRIEPFALVPQPALVAHLHRRAAEDHRTEAGVPHVAQGLHQQRPGLPPAGPPPRDGAVGGG